VLQHPKDIGDRTTLAVMLALHDAGFAVLVPFGENTRYDLVIDDGVRLARVQCKTGRLRDGAVRFRPCSYYAHHPNPKTTHRHYAGQVEWFGVHCPETDGVYLIPIEDVPNRRSAALRVDPPRNGQRKKIRAAAAYQIGTVAARPSTTGRRKHAQLTL
jgi:PD-(D/E)XK nuclease superfamily protein